MVNIRYVPPYKSSPAITSSPGFKVLKTQSIAAKPDEKAKPCVPFSIEAKEFYNAVLVGFAALEYSYPL